VPLECERWQWRELFASEHGPSDTGTRLVLFVLALHMNQDGESAYPAQELIARRSGLSVRSVRKHLQLAEQGGWLNIHQKRRRGQAWFVNEYAATIPDGLAELCKSKPWEDDPTWGRAENSAGRLDHPAMSRENKHPANGARRPAIDAEHPANASVTPGKICRDARQGLPTNTSDNSSMNSPLNTPCEGAVASASTDAADAILKIRGKIKASRPDIYRDDTGGVGAWTS
jgi:hypothetical protein